MTALPRIELPSTQISFSPTPQSPDITGGEKQSNSSHDESLLSWRNTASGSWFIQVQKIRDNNVGNVRSWSCAIPSVQNMLVKIYLGQKNILVKIYSGHKNILVKIHLGHKNILIKIYSGQKIYW